MSNATPKAGLEGIVAGTTAIATVQQDDLTYRGYSVEELADHASYEEVAYLLLVGQKPSPAEIKAFREELVAERALPGPVVDYLASVGPMVASGSAVPMDVMRTAVSLLGNLDPESQSLEPAAALRKAKRLVAKAPTIIGHMQRVIDGEEMVDTKTGGNPALSHAANLMYLMTGEKPAAQVERVMDVSLILYTEHDFNASTFVGRCIAATLSDMHGAVTGAIAALKGPLHGGANEQAMEMLKEIKEAMDEGMSVPEWMSNAFASKRKLMGFGHRVYKKGDHRAPILDRYGRALARAKNDGSLRWFEIGDEVSEIMLESKQIYPNVDFPCGMTYYTMGIPVPQYTPIFVAARMSGWCAHILEQHANNRLIRPLAEYTGPGRRPWRDA